MALRDLAYRFVSQTAANIDLIREKLHQANNEIAHLEQQLGNVSLAAAVSGDFAEANKLQAKLAEDRDRVVVLRHALAAAEAEENQRLTEARSKQQRATLRAMRQHLSARTSAAAEVEKAVAALAGAFLKLRNATAAARALIPPGAVGQTGYFTMSDAATSRLVQREVARQGHESTPRGDLPFLPGADRSVIDGMEVPQLIAPIATVVREAAERDAADFARSLGLLPALPPKAPEPPGKGYDGPTPGTDRWHELRAQHLAERTPEHLAAAPPIVDPAPIEEKSDALATILSHFPPAPAGPRNPWPEGTPEHEGYAREIEAIAASVVTADEPQEAEEQVVATPAAGDEHAPPTAASLRDLETASNQP
jgi:hypothetical protein